MPESALLPTTFDLPNVDLVLFGVPDAAHFRSEQPSPQPPRIALLSTGPCARVPSVASRLTRQRCRLDESRPRVPGRRRWPRRCPSASLLGVAMTRTDLSFEELRKFLLNVADSPERHPFSSQERIP
ncbi:MAG: hypothetical protein ROZ37_18960 [Aromatoleum sp.]|uniref:hypothetical protein n=1 Tax=Aromatoleum sp. TaxID=2307007 RepID=UPI002895582C|nr:hypothetical protein [Aromatoleum sp.]MDT3672406.1 hypothetical protein [Aromatoleum sp.]